MSKRTFRRVFVILTVVYAVAIAVGLLCFRQYLKHYEENHPVGVMNAYFAALASNDTAKILADADFPFDDLNTQEAYLQYLREKYPETDKRQYAELPSDTDGRLLFAVYANDQQRGTLTLQKREDDTYRVFSDWELRPMFTVTSPAVPLLNGVSLAAYCEGGDPTVVPAFAGVGGTLPTVSTYTVRTLLPETVTLPDGDAVLTWQEDGTLLVTAKPQESDTVALTAFAEKAARTFACYISKDAPFSDLSAMLESNTPFSRDVRAYDNYWYNQHRSVDFENMQVSAPVAWSADAFTVEVSFDFIVRRTYDSHTYPTQYRIACRRTANGFSVTNIQPV